MECRNGPQKLLSDFEELKLLSLILQYSGIYLHELQDKLQVAFGVRVSAATICRTLKFMGYSRQAIRFVAIQQSDAMRVNSWQRSLFTTHQCSSGLMRVSAIDATPSESMDIAYEAFVQLTTDSLSEK